MHRSTRTVFALVTLLSAVAAIAPGVAAQDEATAMAEHPLVGAWIIEPIADEPPELMIIIPGGIVTEAGPQGTAYGSWTPTGERTPDAT